MLRDQKMTQNPNRTKKLSVWKFWNLRMYSYTFVQYIQRRSYRVTVLGSWLAYSKIDSRVKFFEPKRDLGIDFFFFHLIIECGVMAIFK